MSINVHCAVQCIFDLYVDLFKSLKRQSHEKVYEFLTWDGSFSLN
jgi:hypothetical protein